MPRPAPPDKGLRQSGICMARHKVCIHIDTGKDGEGMATLIPALGTCVTRMTSGERRLAERLEQKLEGDYLLWYDVPIGPKQTHPDFVVLHPRRGLLGTKD